MRLSPSPSSRSIPSPEPQLEARSPGPPDVKSLLLAVEVLSPSSLRTDRVKKRDFYLDNGVEEYWVVDLDARVIERWRQSQETPELLHDRLDWAPHGGDPLVVDLGAFFERVDKKVRIFGR